MSCFRLVFVVSLLLFAFVLLSLRLCGRQVAALVMISMHGLEMDDFVPDRLWVYSWIGNVMSRSCSEGGILLALSGIGVLFFRMEAFRCYSWLCLKTRTLEVLLERITIRQSISEAQKRSLSGPKYGKQMNNDFVVFLFFNVIMVFFGALIIPTWLMNDS